MAVGERCEIPLPRGERIQERLSLGFLIGRMSADGEFSPWSSAAVKEDDNDERMQDTTRSATGLGDEDTFPSRFRIDSINEEFRKKRRNKGSSGTIWIRCKPAGNGGAGPHSCRRPERRRRSRPSVVFETRESKWRGEAGLNGSGSTRKDAATTRKPASCALSG
jgi:hypothetical protein